MGGRGVVTKFADFVITPLACAFYEPDSFSIRFFLCKESNIHNHMTITRHLRIHGDNIIECERSLSLLSKALNVHPEYVATSPTCMPMYMLGTIQVDLLSGHGRWGVDIATALSKHGGILREGADSYITEIIGSNESIILALEYCSALPAGNNAWQRNGRAFSSVLAGVPYLYIAEIGGVELDENRNVKAPRFPNPVVPFSYLTASKRLKSICLPIYTAHPSITDTLYKKYSKVFGMAECLLVIEALVKGKDYSDIAAVLTTKALGMVKLLAGDRRSVDTLRGSEWDNLLKSRDKASWLQRNTLNIVWKKKTADKISTTKTFNKLFTKVLSYKCNTIGAKDLPICIIPDNKRKEFEAYLGKLYPVARFNFDTSKPLAIVWITGFKPHGDDSRPDRGLSPLAKMVLGNDAQIMAVVYGPAKESTWKAFKESPKELSKENGLWQSIINLCDYVLVDSSTCKGKLLYKTNAKLKHNTKSICFKYEKPIISFSEHDTDTTIHQLFSRKEHLNVFESLCNPPGGDWSGISYFASTTEEYRWTSLPRVSAAGGKRPDHIIQIKKADKEIFLSIESKIHGRDLENNIGNDLKTYIKELFKNLPTACRSAKKEWRLFEGDKLRMRSNSFISIGAYAFESLDDMKKQLKRGKLDVVFAFEFGKVTTLHVHYNNVGKEIENILKQVQLGLDGLKIQVH